MDRKKELTIPKIENGTVADHLSPKTVYKVVKIIDLENDKVNVSSTATNLESHRVPGGKKDILKIENRELTPDEVNKISLLSPYATINIIRNYEVVKKYRVELPDEIVGIAKCSNPNCISNPKTYEDGTVRSEPVSYRFKVVDKVRPVIRCYYCEREPEDISKLI